MPAPRPQLTDFLPTTAKEMAQHGWKQADVILFTGDAYIDHPAFGAGVVGRLLQAHGLKVAIVPQPDWRGDLRDFKKLGEPTLFFGVTAGAMDSRINHYTANKRLRSDDAYSANGKPGMRPDLPTVTYTRILKSLFPHVPVVLGGIEASLRRLTHYDYWEDKLRPSILIDAPADLLFYGMAEQALLETVAALKKGIPFEQIRNIPQTAYTCISPHVFDKDLILHSHEECLASKSKQAENFKHFETESNKMHARRLVQRCSDRYVVVNPPFPPMAEAEIDRSYDLPYTRLPHPKYREKSIPAYEMIKFSVTLHRGCFGGCAFCTISAHQGKFIASRSKRSILSEVKKITQMPDFKGYISDLGGPSANMYAIAGYDREICARCPRPSCLHPKICKNLNIDLSPLLQIYRSVDRLPGIKKSFIGSGVRYDMLLHRTDSKANNIAVEEYTRELILAHVSGRLKVAPEHTAPAVLNCMRKPSFALFERFRDIFEQIDKKYNLRQQLIPYFISSHPACTEEDMAELAVMARKMGYTPQQVQDFTPSPMTLATEIFYTGLHPYTLQPVYTAKTKEEKQGQLKYFFFYKIEYRAAIINSLKKMGRSDMITKLFH